MLMYETCAHESAEPEDSLRLLMDRLLGCQEEFMVWYEGDNQSYAPTVAAFRALRAILETALPMLHAWPERSHTIQPLQSDVDEIVAKMLAEPTVHPHIITPAASACIHSLLSRLHSCT
jgi:hypothetical protein